MNTEQKQELPVEARLINYITDHCGVTASVDQHAHPECLDRVILAVSAFYKDEARRKAELAKLNHGMLTFGKYRGKNINKVWLLDPEYCSWLWFKSRKFLTDSVKAELGEIMRKQQGK